MELYTYNRGSHPTWVTKENLKENSFFHPPSDYKLLHLRALLLVGVGADGEEFFILCWLLPLFWRRFTFAGESFLFLAAAAEGVSCSLLCLFPMPTADLTFWNLPLTVLASVFLFCGVAVVTRSSISSLPLSFLILARFFTSVTLDRTLEAAPALPLFPFLEDRFTSFGLISD